ncbi:MAG: hypothetical protein JWO67_2062 [Streptosporangiaceae bacterium]|jgi:uncharacterized protein with NRDE domain|nr:hypothetical protein [Streptosporangiaceae bacterium]
MCTAVVRFDPTGPVPVLLAGIRDEFLGRPWRPPAAHWPDRPGLIGGHDLRAGGTWLAVDPAVPRVACVLNGRGRPAADEVRVSRGVLPLQAAAHGGLGDLDLERLDPFHLLCAEPGLVSLWSWDGRDLTGQRLRPGLHLVVNSGLEGRDPAHAGPGDEHLSARVSHLRPRLESALLPPLDGGSPAAAWGEWLPLVDGDGLDRADPRALLVRQRFGDGVYGTTSVSLIALSAERVRYDFNPDPGNPAAWGRVV